MCLGIPMQILKIDGNVASAGLGGTNRCIYLDVLDKEIQVGDYVIVHAGFAIRKIDDKEAQETLNLFRDAGFILPESETDVHHEVH